MFRANGLGKWAAIAALACAGVAMGQTAVAPAAPTGEKAMQPTPSTPLMGLLQQSGVGQPLKDAHINIFGHVEGSYTYDASSPPHDHITGRAFDFENEDLTLNQLYLVTERKVDVNSTNFDIGGRMDWMYGADARVIHSNGLFDYEGLPRSLGGPGGPENQFDLTQAYFDVALPVGNGLRIRAGKFVTLAGAETIDPTTNALYSHSFLFIDAIPFTQTGAYATYAFNDQWAIDGGFSRGWDQSLEDNNSAIDGFGRISWTPDKKNALYVTGIFGPENPGDNANWRELIDVVWTYAYSDQLSFTLNGDYGHDGAAGGAQWYGIAGYATLKLADPVSVTGRLEWFSDTDGARGLGTNVYEATLGLQLTPFPNDVLASNWKIRPEIRVDYADDAIFDNGTGNSQFTAAIESYFMF